VGRSREEEEEGTPLHWTVGDDDYDDDAIQDLMFPCAPR